MKNLILLTIFIFFLIFTSIIKNTTRTIEKELVKLNKEIKELNILMEEATLEYEYLTSPSYLQSLHLKFFDENLIHYKREDIKNLN